MTSIGQHITSVAWVAAAVIGSSVCYAQEPASDAFVAACNKALEDTVQQGRRVCVIGVVESDTIIRVLFSNSAEVTFQPVEVYESPVQQGHEEALKALDQLKGQVVAVGGFENGTTIYSAQLLSPKPGP